MRLTVIAKLLLFAFILTQSLTASKALASGFYDKYYYSKVADFLTGVQGRQQLVGRVFDMDQGGRTVVGDCSDIHVQYTFDPDYLDFKVVSMKTGVVMHEIFERRGEVTLKRLNKNNLEVVLDHPTDRWLDSEKSVLKVKKDDSGQVTEIDYRTTSLKGSIVLWSSQVAWRKGVVCRSK